MPYQFKALLNEANAPGPANPIHSTEGGKAHGFKGALVAGIQVYGWTTGAFIEVLGEEWLDSGWVELAFRKPTYNGDFLTVNINGNEFTVTNNAADLCVQGRVGHGSAPWAEHITQTCWNRGIPSPDSRPKLTLNNAPKGQPLMPMEVELGHEAHEDFVIETLGDAGPLFRGEEARCHPAWLAGRMIYLLHHSYDYGPALHTNSQIQNLAPATPGQRFTVTGYCHDAFDKNGHHFIVNDGSIWSEEKAELVRIRHTAIFKLRTA